MAKLGQRIEEELENAQYALARGDISNVEGEEMDELLAAFRLNLDRESRSYRELALALLRKKVGAAQAFQKRHQGEPVETPRVAEPDAPEDAAPGSSLRAAFEGWQKTKVRSPSTLREFDLAIRLFEQLHGGIPVASITRAHVRHYREALQAIPVRRSGKLRDAALPELVEWSRRHSEQPRIAPRTVNKLLAAPMAVASWAYDNGIIPDDTPWANPFAKMLLDVDEAQREPWQLDELRTLFNSPVFTKGARPKAGRGEAAYWLPLLGIFTGARLSELASLAVSDVVTDPQTNVVYLKIAEDEERGRKLKTVSSRRAVPLHPELVKLGFLSQVVGPRLSKAGSSAQLFPELVLGPKGQYGDHWSKWFGRYIRQIGISNKASVFHSFRHGFKDALRAGGVSEDVNDALTGHAGGGVGRSYGAKDMIRRFGLPRLAEAIARVEYPRLDLSHLMVP
jgi:integrase